MQFFVKDGAVIRVFVHVAVDERPLTSDNQAYDAFIKRLFKPNDLVRVRAAIEGSDKMLLFLVEQPDAARIGRYPLKSVGSRTSPTFRHRCS